MLKRLELSGFRGQQADYDLSPSVTIEGRNGAGKSSIKEAVCFVFCGTDSLGTRVPLHLLPIGGDKLKVSVTTSKVVLNRTLTKNKHSAISYEKDGQKFTLTQTELEKMLCPSDLFLSVFVPGAFMQFTATKRHAIFNQLVPQVDRPQIMYELTGIEPSHPLLAAADWSHRPDAIALSFAQKRRMIQGEVKAKEEQLLSYANVQSVEPPVKPESVEEYEALSKKYEVWSSYNIQMAKVKERAQHISYALASNQKTDATRADLHRQLEAISNIPIPAPQSFDEEIDALRVNLQPLPQSPRLQGVVSTDHCPTCGQVVGTKHKEQVCAENEALEKAYKAKLAEAETHNERVKKKIFDVEAKKNVALVEVSRAQEKNRKAETEKAVLQARIRGLTTVLVPESVEEPNPPPFEEVTYDQLKSAEKENLAYQSALSKYAYAQKVKDEADQKSAGIRQQISDAQAQIELLSKLESAALQITAREFEIRQSILSIPGYKFTGEDEVFLTDERGVPYQLLSAAEKVKADVSISLKIHSLMTRKLGMIFIDNAELLDQQTMDIIKKECEAQSMQTFFVYVDGSKQEVVVR